MKTDVSKIRPAIDTYSSIEYQRGIVAAAAEKRDADYLSMREYARVSNAEYQERCVNFAGAYNDWKDETEKLRAMVAE